MSIPPVLAVTLGIALLALAGQAVAARLPGTRPQRLVVGVLAGAVLLHGLLIAADLLDLRWSAWLVLGFLLLAATLGRGGLPATPTRGPGPGDVVALLAVVAFALLAWTLWIANPDFVYHWGLKGHRFYLSRGIDYRFLAQAQGWAIHPDYPNLYPELLAVTALLSGGWDERGLLLWSPLLLLLLLVAVRELLAGEGVPAMRRHAVVASLGLGLAAFGIGHQMAGAADWLIALALVAALPVLLAPPSTAGAVQLGVVAAFAAAAKQEGVALAASLIAVQLARYLLRRQRPSAGALGVLVFPTAATLGWWAARVAHHGLYQTFDKGAPTSSGLVAALPSMVEGLDIASWHRLSWLAVLLLPALLAAPRMRPFVAVAAAQVALYLASYAAETHDVWLLVITTLPRFVLHLLPATVAAAAVAWLGEPALRRGAAAFVAGSGASGGSGGAHLDHLGEDGDGDLAGRVAADR